MSPTCFGARYAIIREKSYHFIKPSAYCKVVNIGWVAERVIKQPTPTHIPQVHHQQQDRGVFTGLPSWLQNLKKRAYIVTTLWSNIRCRRSLQARVNILETKIFNIRKKKHLTHNCETISTFRNLASNI